MELDKAQYLFIQSKNRVAGNSYDFQITIPDGLIECSEDQYIRITLMNMTVYHSWYGINNGFNTLRFTNLGTMAQTTVVIPEGNYAYSKLATTLTSLYTPLTCVYNSQTNKLQFSFQQATTMDFLDGSYSVLGFANNNPRSTMGGIISSDTVLTPTQTTNICLNIPNLTPANSLNLQNTNDGKTKVSNMLLAMPLTSDPFQLITYNNTYNGESQFGLVVYERKLNILRFQFTDFDGNLLTYIPDSTLSLKIEILTDTTQNNQIRDDVREIKNFIRMMLISQHLLNNTDQPDFNAVVQN